VLARAPAVRNQRKINAALVPALAAEFKEQFSDQGIELMGSTPGGGCRLRQSPARELDAHADGDGPTRRSISALISAAGSGRYKHLRNGSVPGIFSAQRFKT